MLELTRIGRGKKRQGDNAHRFLSIIRPMGEPHVGGAEELQFSKPWLWHLGLRKTFLVYGFSFVKRSRPGDHLGLSPSP